MDLGGGKRSRMANSEDYEKQGKKTILINLNLILLISRKYKNKPMRSVI